MKLLLQEQSKVVEKSAEKLNSFKTFNAIMFLRKFVRGNFVKKFISIFVLGLFLLPLSVQAKTVKVVSLQHFSTEFPLEVYNVQTLERVDLGKGLIVERGTIIAGKVVRVERPKIGQQNAYFEFVPTYMSYKGVVQAIDNPDYVAQIVGYRKIDSGKAAICGAKMATNFLTMGASLGISFVQGLTEAEEGYRLESGLTRLYKDSPLFFVGVGSELNIEVGDALKFKVKKNYSN